MIGAVLTQNTAWTNVEKAIANLGYYQVQFIRPVYPGDTLRAFTKVLERKDRGADKPGIVIDLRARAELFGAIAGQGR